MLPASDSIMWVGVDFTMLKINIWDAVGSTPAECGSVCCFEKNVVFVATAFWILLFLLPLYISQDLVWLGFKKIAISS